MIHDDYMEKIERYLAGDLPKEDEIALIKHMESCEECSRAFKDAKEFEKAISSTLIKVGNSLKKPELKTTALEKDLALARRKRKRLSRIRNWGFIFTITAVLLFAFAMLLYTSAMNSMKMEETTEKLESMRLKIMQSGILESDDADYQRLVLALFGATGAPPMTEPIALSEMDPWGNPYMLLFSENGLIIYSFGPDELDQYGYGDDIAVSIISMANPDALRPQGK